MKGHVSAPDVDAIAKLAYQLWEERGRQLGSAERDWYEAERQLKKQSRAITPSPTGRPRAPEQSTGVRVKRRRSV